MKPYSRAPPAKKKLRASKVDSVPPETPDSYFPISPRSKILYHNRSPSIMLSLPYSCEDPNRTPILQDRVHAGKTRSLRFMALSAAQRPTRLETASLLAWSDLSPRRVTR